MTAILLNELTRGPLIPPGEGNRLPLEVKKMSEPFAAESPLPPSYLTRINYNSGEFPLISRLNIATDMGDGEGPCMREHLSSEQNRHEDEIFRADEGGL